MYNPAIRDQAFKEESATFFQTSNSKYGENWQSQDSAAAGQEIVKNPDVPLYKEIGDREVALNHTKKVFKHELLKDMRKTGELDTAVYAEIEREKTLIKKQDSKP